MTDLDKKGVTWEEDEDTQNHFKNEAAESQSLSSIYFLLSSPVPLECLSVSVCE